MTFHMSDFRANAWLLFGLFRVRPFECLDPNSMQRISEYCFGAIERVTIDIRVANVDEDDEEYRDWIGEDERTLPTWSVFFAVLWTALLVGFGPGTVLVARMGCCCFNWSVGDEKRFTELLRIRYFRSSNLLLAAVAYQISGLVMYAIHLHSVRVSGTNLYVMEIDYYFLDAGFESITYLWLFRFALGETLPFALRPPYSASTAIRRSTKHVFVAALATAHFVLLWITYASAIVVDRATHAKGRRYLWVECLFAYILHVVRLLSVLLFVNFCVETRRDARFSRIGGGASRVYWTMSVVGCLWIVAVPLEFFGFVLVSTNEWVLQERTAFLVDQVVSFVGCISGLVVSVGLASVSIRPDRKREACEKNRVFDDEGKIDRGGAAADDDDIAMLPASDRSRLFLAERVVTTNAFRSVSNASRAFESQITRVCLVADELKDAVAGLEYIGEGADRRGEAQDNHSGWERNARVAPASGVEMTALERALSNDTTRESGGG
eukprot:g2206.t1